jgi:hypothetical protein
MKIIERTNLGLIFLMVGLHKYRLVAGYDHHPLGTVLGMPVPATGLTGFVYIITCCRMTTILWDLSLACLYLHQVSQVSYLLSLSGE